jgi:hypothetical protein
MHTRVARIAVSSAALIALVLLAACGSGTSTAEPRVEGRLFHTSDLPIATRAMFDPPNTLADPAAAAEALGHGNIFKDEPEDVVKRLKSLGFVRTELEVFHGAGISVGAVALQFKSPSQARAAQSYMYAQLLKPCPGQEEIACQVSKVLAVPDIPGAKGQIWSPVREPRAKGVRAYGATQYKVLFVINSLVYGVAMGGNVDAWDPASVPKEDALAAMRRVYQRVRDLRPAAIFPSPIPLPECPPDVPPDQCPSR